ncbi:Gfo/Idh/MocA family protein [Pseudactinotalea suaedae]|uniref:Gfo/Idh/MocA family protein n=1 Tax=Pseudactinotalea suaedae TaxID=1524924 RepID=UPI0012E17E83|nr:Gfo/Idh/MocA family oxidoreductase [Pseudactinotalea suaedae]
MTTSTIPTFAVLGVHGYGRLHLAELATLAAEGVAELVAVADPRGAEGVESVPEGTPCYPDLDALLAAVVPDVVVLATPIHTHAPLAIQAMRAGANVLVEKPTAASLAEFEQMVAVSEDTGRAVQVGFQSFGSHAFAEIERLCASGTIGEVTGVGGVGTWLRTLAYYQRSRWAGMRSLDGVPVVDGVVTNPLAHAIATALKIAGAVRTEDVASVEVELFHAHDIEADDTSSVRVVTAAGTTATFGLTLCAADQDSPVITVQGTEGELVLAYTADVLEVRTAAGTSQQRTGRTSLQRNLVEHLADPDVPLLAPVAETGAFMRVLEAVRTAPDPVQVGEAHVTWLGEGDEAHPVITDVEAWCRRAAAEHKLFSELGAPWALPADR